MDNINYLGFEILIDEVSVIKKEGPGWFNYSTTPNEVEEEARKCLNEWLIFNFSSKWNWVLNIE